MRLFGSIVLLSVLFAGTAEVTAAPQSPGLVILAPVASTGGEAKNLRKLEALIEAGISALPGAKLISATSAAKATRKAKRPELRICDGDTTCLTELGRLLGAKSVIYAEVSDLGDAQVIYLKSIDVSSGKELRSTTLKLGKGSDRNRESKAAAAQLLTPRLYTGTLHVKTTVSGATVFLDGHKVATTPSKPVAVYVGSHALRVTHPEHSDYVRFVDINFEENTVVVANLLGLPGVSRKLSAEGVLGGGSGEIVQYRERPWYYRWYTITGGVAVVAITSAILASGGSTINADLIRDL